MSRSTLLLDSLHHSTQPSTPDQRSTFTRVTASGRLAATVDATSTILRLRAKGTDPQNFSGGQRVTVVTRSLAPVFSQPQIHAWQGRIVQNQNLTGLLPKGARSRGYDIARLGDLLDIVPESDPKALDEARNRVEAIATLFADAKDLTPDSFAALPIATDDTAEAPCTMAILTTLSSPDRSRVGGALWLLRDRIPGPQDLGDALQGVLIVPPSALTSEHGSLYTSRLPQTTAVLPLSIPIPWPDASGMTDPGAYLTAIDRLAPTVAV
ncbi:hypothetical protein ACFVZ3_39190 [Kitasatospora purpeofusca]|uniref:hypothetical protein n=1 Tax=Kitasatospora purpeofusca TaxID=67352 RepID=UPI0036C82668